MRRRFRVIANASAARMIGVMALSVIGPPTQGSAGPDQLAAA